MDGPASAGLLGPLAGPVPATNAVLAAFFAFIGASAPMYLPTYTVGPRVPDSSSESAAGTAFVAVSWGPQAGLVPGGCPAPNNNQPASGPTCRADARLPSKNLADARPQTTTQLNAEAICFRLARIGS